MNKVYSLLICITCLLASGCSGEREVNGRSMSRAYKSAKVMKEYLRKDQKLQFQVAFWTLKNAYSDDEEFLDAVGGKTAAEIIPAGKAKFEELHANGYADYQKYSSWEDMIEQNQRERDSQDLKSKPDNRDRANNVLYDLH